MSPERDPVPRARAAGHWLGGILLLGVLAGGVVAAGLALWQNLDVRQLVRAPATMEAAPLPVAMPPAAPAAASGTFRVAVLYSEASAAFFPDSAYYPGLLARWERLVTGLGGEAFRVTAAGLDSLDARETLIAPAALCLADSEVRSLRSHVQRGGGLVLTWATGARDGRCEWVGWDRVAELTGAADVRELEGREALYLTVPAGLPLSPGLDPATRIELRSESQLALTTLGARAFWSDWALNPSPAAGTDEVDTAAWVGRSESGGRLAWFGFLGGQGAGPRDEERIERLQENAILWTAGIPYAEIAPWPADARAAIVFSQDVESAFSNSVEMAGLAKVRGIPLSFYVVSRLALDHPELADTLARAGEVASQTSDHGVVAALPLEEQRARLRRSWSELRGWTGDSAVGLRPPEERFDENTLAAWRSIGGTYVAGLNDARTGSPEIFETAAGRIVLLPRIIKDDYNVLVQESAFGSRRLREAYLEGVRKVRGLGGLAFVSTHSQVAGTAGRVPVLGEVMDSVLAQGEDWWIATGRAVASWWLARREATTELSRGPASGLEVAVRASDAAGLENAWLRLVSPDDAGLLVPWIDGEPVAFVRDDWGVSVPVGMIAAGRTRRIILLPEGAGEDHTAVAAREVASGAEPKPGGERSREGED